MSSSVPKYDRPAEGKGAGLPVASTFPPSTKFASIPRQQSVADVSINDSAHPSQKRFTIIPQREWKAKNDQVVRQSRNRNRDRGTPTSSTPETITILSDTEAPLSHSRLEKYFYDDEPAPETSTNRYPHDKHTLRSDSSYSTWIVTDQDKQALITQAVQGARDDVMNMVTNSTRNIRPNSQRLRNNHDKIVEYMKSSTSRSPVVRQGYIILFIK